MRKKILFLATFLVIQSIHAQFKLVGESPVFEEPTKGCTKILQLKNGYTVYLNLVDKLNVKIYDEKHRLSTERELTLSIGSLKSILMEGIFEISGDVVMLISKSEETTQTLYRILVDGKSGTLKETKEILQLDQQKKGAGNNLPGPGFWLKKDPDSDHYALAIFHSMQSDGNRKFELVYYGPGHQELAHAHYNSTQGKFKNMNYIDMAVIGGKSIALLAKAVNSKDSGGEERELVLVSLDATAKEVELTKLDGSMDMKLGYGIVKYNPVTKKVILVANAFTKKNPDLVTPYMAIIDPFARKQEVNTEIYPVQAVAKSVEVFGKKNAFWGLPQNLYINNDGSFTVVSEEVTSISGKIAATVLSNLAIVNYSIIGTVTGSYFIPKSHVLYNKSVPSFYQADREGTGLWLDRGNQFKYFFYLDGAKKCYVIFNDVEENRQRVMKGKVTSVQDLGECDAYFFNISGTDVMPQRELLFRKTESRGQHQMGLFAVSDYDRQKNMLVTLKLENDRGDKGVKVVWLQPE